jgi:hypothetical protein
MSGVARVDVQMPTLERRSAGESGHNGRCLPRGAELVTPAQLRQAADGMGIPPGIKNLQYYLRVLQMIEVRPRIPCH